MSALDTLRAQHTSRGRCICCWSQVKDHPHNRRTICSCGQHEPCETARLLDEALSDARLLREGDWATLSRNLRNAETERDDLRMWQQIHRADLGRTDSENAALGRALTDAHATIARVRALHAPADCKCGCGVTICTECLSEAHPCPTIRALDGAVEQ